MRKQAVILFLILLSLPVFCQQPDTASIHYDIEQVIISATRTPKLLCDIPGQADIISSKMIEELPVNNVDDALRSVGNIFVNRSWGIFSKNASVTMRGLESSSRTLVLIDGVPKNKIAGGSVNWHNIHPDRIERIEVIKGPASALYGNNAMGGVINIITKKPDEPLSVSAELFYGSYTTMGGNARLAGQAFKNDAGFYWSLNGNYRQGDGYIFEPLEYLDDTDVETYLEEWGLGGKLGYKFNSKHTLELAYDYYDELRGGGRQVFEEKGSFDAYLTNQLRLIYNGNIGENSIQAALYYNYEDYHNQKESLNTSNEYSLSHAGTDKTDMGSWITLTRPIGENQVITIGGEAKNGNVLGDEIYRTTPDMIHYRGYLDYYALYLQDQISLFRNKLEVIAGIRGDRAFFRDGFQEVKYPSKVTGFPEAFAVNFKRSNWQAVSPKISLQYNLNKGHSLYALIGTGFTPPKLDDLCKSGKIRKGFRLANPDLKPETLTNYEIGFKTSLLKKLQLSAAAYYSLGKDFYYLVSTGDTIDTGGSSLKPVYRRENVTSVGITGFELSLKYHILEQLSFQGSYSYNHSVIIDYNAEGKELAGKYIVEVPPHLFFAGMTWRYRFVTSHLNCSYTDSQWANDENTIRIENNFLVNLKVQAGFMDHFQIYASCQNIFDVEFIDRKNQLSPGRFLLAGIKYLL